MKTKEELNALKEEVAALNKKLAELTEDELTQVTGGNWEEQFRQSYDELQHNLDVAAYLGEFHNKLMNGDIEGARKYYNSIKSELNDVRGCHGNIEDVLKAYLEGSIADSAESCSHHDCGEHEDKPVFIIPKF